MCFERRLTCFSHYIFGFADFSRKRPFLRGESGDAKILQTVRKRGFAVSAAISTGAWALIARSEPGDQV
jgi:hypothetical protein